MSSKKKQRNGFFYFMLDMKEELRRQGRNVPMAQMSALAGPRWSQLPEAQKAEYNLRAKHEKRQGYGYSESVITSRPGRMDCMGELLSERRDPVAERQEKRRKQKEFLQDCLPVKKDVVLLRFYLLDILPLCEFKDLEKDRFIPCEMAVVEFSLAHGIHKSLHHFVDPGPIPVGHRYEAQSQSDRTHILPVGGFDLAETDYRRLLSELQSVTCSSSSSSSGGAGAAIPLVFASREAIERVEFLLQWMADKAGIDLFLKEVFEMELLLIVLDSISHVLYPPEPNSTSPSSPGCSITEYQATELLNTTVYDYESNTKCDWHEQREVNYCSLATVNKYRYVLSDHLCTKFHISITPRHLPEQSDKPVATVKVLPRANYSSHPRGVSSDMSDLSTGMQNMGMSQGRGMGRGMGLSSVRQPMAGRGMK